MDAKAVMQQFVAKRARNKQRAAADRYKRCKDALPSLVEGILEVDPDISLVILFGSMCRPADSNIGDIDLAIRSDRFLKVAGWLLRQDVPVDVVDMDEVYEHIRERIFSEGTVLYERS